MNDRRGGRVLPLLGAAAALAAAGPAVGPPAARAAALAVSFALLPGALLAGRLAPRAGRAERALLALGLSPALAGGAGALLMLSGLDAGAAARIAAGVCALWALIEAARPSPAPERDGAVPWIAAGIWTAVIAALLVGNPWLPPRSDGWFHAAVARQISERGVPPEDPFFGGLRLLYFWGVQAWAALWLGAEPRLAVWTPLVTLNLSAAFAVVLGACAIARRLGAGRGGRWMAAALATLGYAPFAWLWIVARAATGQVRGMEELRRMLTNGPETAMAAMGTFLLHSSMAFFGDKFLVLTPFGMGLALFAAWLLALIDLSGSPRIRPAARLAVITAATLFVHTVVGLTEILVGGAWWAWGAWRAARAGGGIARRLVAMPIALAAGLAATAPYLFSATAGKGGRQLAPGVSAASVATLILSGLLVAPAGFAWLARARRERPAAATLWVPALALAALGLGLRLSEHNQSKFFNLLFLLLAAPAAVAWLDLARRAPGLRRALIVGVLVVGALPTASFAVLAFSREHGQVPERWQRPRPAELEACRWVRTHTPADALVADAWGARDLMVFGGRSALWGGPRGERDWGYPPRALEARRRAVRELCAGGDLSPASRALLARLGREVLVVGRARTAGDTASAWEAVPRHPARYRELYRNREVAVYRWEGGP